jgi:formylglycine-generating enzyme required for sulfatase activity
VVPALSNRLNFLTRRDVLLAHSTKLDATALFPCLLEGSRFRDFDAAPEMIVVPAGEFMMGSPTTFIKHIMRKDLDTYFERPQHKITIKNPFAVSIAPVTRGEFASFIDATNYTPGEDEDGRTWRNPPDTDQEDDHPVVHVNWHDAQAYVAWLRERSGGKAYRLLSEAEWEYCCRAGTTSEHSTGNTITREQAAAGRNTASVFKFAPNPWGLRDMHGNVWEWCEDNWHRNYRGNPPTDGSVWSGGDESYRVVRGGSWVSYPEGFRSAERSTVEPDVRDSDVGFRVARAL